MALDIWIGLFEYFCFFFTMCAVYGVAVHWWDSKFDDYYATDEGGEDTGDGFINAAMFQDME